MAIVMDLRSDAEKVEVELSETALQIEDLLWKPRSQRRKFVRYLAEFDNKRAELRNVMSKFERGARGRSTDEDGPDDGERRHFKRLRQRLHMLGRISRALDLIQKGRVLPLYLPLPDKHSIEMTQGNVMDAVMTALHRVVNPASQAEDAAELGCFRDIPLTSSKFVAHMHAAYRVALAQKRRHETRFVDVGCGGGVKVLLAGEVFHRADGFDYDQGYVDAAAENFRRAGAHRSHAFWANALTYEGYDQYDVIYFFQPMDDDEGLRALEDQVLACARPGTIIVATYQKFLFRLDELNCERIEDSVYVAGIDPDTADALRAEAQRIGPDILHPERIIHAFHVDWLRGLWMACAANGYLPD